MQHTPSLTIFRGRAGDRNPRGVAGAVVMGNALARRLGAQTASIGEPAEPSAGGWDVELEAARPGLRILAEHYGRSLAEARVPITAMGRCAAAIATLPVVARHRPDAVVVWFDAQGDCNTPASSPSGYLGGMPIAGAAGLWETGFGDDLDLANVILVGTRDLDPGEKALIDAGTLRLVPPGPELPDLLRRAVGGRPAFVHLDCDVLDPGIVPTEYVVEGGLSLDDLTRAAMVLAESELVGLEITEFEDRWADTGLAGSPDGVIAALEPLMARLVGPY